MRVIKLLQSLNIAWTSTRYLYLPQRVYVTTDFVFIRWLGRHGVYDSKDYERVDKTDELREWLADIYARHAEDGFTHVYGFFNDEYAGFAPGTCQKFKRLVGLPAPPLDPPQQQPLL